MPCITNLRTSKPRRRASPALLLRAKGFFESSPWSPRRCGVRKGRGATRSRPPPRGEGASLLGTTSPPFARPTRQAACLRRASSTELGGFAQVLEFDAHSYSARGGGARGVVAQEARRRTMNDVRS